MSDAQFAEIVGILIKLTEMEKISSVLSVAITNTPILVLQKLSEIEL